MSMPTGLQNPIHIQNEDEGKMTIGFSTSFIADYVEKHLGEKYEIAISKVGGSSLPIEYIVAAPDVARAECETGPFREVPSDDKQPDFFIPRITEISIKDDVHLMEIAPFTLQPRGEERNELIYEDINGTNIRIKANPEYGLATTLDYDIVLMMQSWLADLANSYRDSMKKYETLRKAGRAVEKPVAPPRYFTPHIKEMLLFSRDYQNAGDNQRTRIEAALNRLKNTNVFISKGQWSQAPTLWLFQLYP